MYEDLARIVAMVQQERPSDTQFDANCKISVENAMCSRRLHAHCVIRAGLGPLANLQQQRLAQFLVQRRTHCLNADQKSAQRARRRFQQVAHGIIREPCLYHRAFQGGPRFADRRLSHRQGGCVSLFNARGSRAATGTMAVYPEAHVDIESNGLALYPSAPAVPKAEARRLGIG